jgi:hypothetical protein
LGGVSRTQPLTNAMLLSAANSGATQAKHNSKNNSENHVRQ